MVDCLYVFRIDCDLGAFGASVCCRVCLFWLGYFGRCGCVWVDVFGVGIRHNFDNFDDLRWILGNLCYFAYLGMFEWFGFVFLGWVCAFVVFYEVFGHFWCLSVFVVFNLLWWIWHLLFVVLLYLHDFCCFGWFCDFCFKVFLLCFALIWWFATVVIWLNNFSWDDRLLYWAVSGLGFGVGIRHKLVGFGII